MRRSLFILLSAFFVAAGTATSLPVSAASDMENLARTLHDSQFSTHVERLLKSNNAAQALELADIGIARNARNVQLRFMRTVALDALGRREEAASGLNALIREYPEIPDPYNNLAVIEAGFGNLEHAAELLRKALTINPNFALAQKNLGDVYLALAVENYERSAAVLTRNAELQSRLKTLKRITKDGV